MQQRKLTVPRRQVRFLPCPVPKYADLLRVAANIDNLTVGRWPLEAAGPGNGTGAA